MARLSRTWHAILTFAQTAANPSRLAPSAFPAALRSLSIRANTLGEMLFISKSSISRPRLIIEEPPRGSSTTIWSFLYWHPCPIPQRQAHGAENQSSVVSFQSSVTAGSEPTVSPEPRISQLPIPFRVTPLSITSRVAAAECGPWRQPWGKDAKGRQSPDRGGRNNRPLQATLSPAKAGLRR